MEKQKAFKEYAKKARERLTGGYWQEVKKDRENFLRTHSDGDNLANLKQMYQKRIQKEVQNTSKPNTEDEKLYKKVVRLLSENEYVLNPIMQLINHEDFDGLSDSAKQNYIFKLTDKYNEMKQRYEKEQKERMVFGR